MNRSLANFFNKLGTFLKSRIGLVLLGFILTTVCGTIINERYTRSGRERDKQFELLKSELTKHDELLTELTKILGMRTFRLQRVVWVTDPEASPEPDTWQLAEEAKTKLNARWDEYYQAVVDWNLGYRNYAIKLRILAGDGVADAFFVRDPSGARKAKSGTLCSYFEHAHDTVAALKKAALTLQIDRTKHDMAQREVDDLYNRVDDFVAQLYRVLAEKERSNEPLKPAQAQH